MYRSCILHIRPNKSQRQALEEILADCCETYNAALQERRDAWRMLRKRVTIRNQQDQITALRQDPAFTKIAVDIQRDPLRRVNAAFEGFFRRCRSGERPGFPRFKARSRYDSFTWNTPLSIRGSFIRIPNLGVLRFKTSQPIPGRPKTACLKRIGRKWQIRLSCDMGPAPEKCSVSNSIGVDLGISSFITLSDGNVVNNPHWAKCSKKTIEACTKDFYRRCRGSKNHLKSKERLRRAHQRIVDLRQNYIHHISKALVDHYDLIAFEKLDIRGMIHGKFTNPIFDASWGQLIYQITYKAESAGKWAVPINPKGTSIRCSRCGSSVYKKLTERQHSCMCGLSIGRDHNAALNIKTLGLSVAGFLPSERATCSTMAIKENTMPAINTPAGEGQEK